MSDIDFQSFGLKPQYSFNELVLGEANQIAAKACMESAKKPGELYNPLVIYGPEGTGKSHLAQATAQEILKKNANAKLKFISAERLINEVISSISGDNAMALRDQYSNFDFLIIDDFQYLLESKVAQAEFVHIFNLVHEKNGQIILTANGSPAKMPGLDKNLKGKLGWGLSAEVSLPDPRMRMDLLRKKMKTFGVELDEKSLSYAAGRLRTSVRELEGFLKKINAYATLSHQSLSMSLVENCVSEFVPEGMEDLPPEKIPPAAENKGGAEVQERVEEEVENKQAQVSGGAPVSRPSGTSGSVSDEKPPRKELEVVMPEAKKETPPPEPEKQIEKEAAPPAPPREEKPAAPKPPAPELKPAPAAEKIERPQEQIPDMPEEEEEDDRDLPKGHKEIAAVFFFPAGSEEALKSVTTKFQEVIKKHKLKFRLKIAGSESYECKQKINYAKFVEGCKKYKAPVAIVIGPPPQAFVPEQDFYDLLSVTLDVQGISLQMVGWNEIKKDYRYLNLALDIALVRNR